MIELFITTLAALFSVVNPLGAVPVFLSLTPHYSKVERSVTARNTGIYFTLLMLGFFLAGNLILTFFGISVNAMRIAGGIIILLAGYNLLGGQYEESRSVNAQVQDEAREKQDISFSPMAMPLLSGPGSISLLITLYNNHDATVPRVVIALVVLLLGALIYLILRSAPLLLRVLGYGGLKALSRIMGCLVMCIGVQYIIMGIVKLVQSTL